MSSDITSADWGKLILRVSIGGMMLCHGIGKIVGAKILPEVCDPFFQMIVVFLKVFHSAYFLFDLLDP